MLRSGGLRTSWSYDELLARSLEVSRALIVCGMGKDARVGILMTNRPEFLAALFGISLAGGVPVALSTFSTAPELGYMLKASQISVLLFEQQVLKTDFHAMIAELEPGIASAACRALWCQSDSPSCNGWLRSAAGRRVLLTARKPRGAGTASSRWALIFRRRQALARADSVHPADTGGIFFSSGTTSQPKGIVHSQRAFAIQWWRWPWTFGMHDPVRAWTGNGFFWSGNISMVLGAALSTGGAVVLQRFFDAEEALRLIEQEKLAFINGRPHQWARLQAAANWASADLSSLKYIPRGEMIQEHPTVDTDWDVPMAFGTTETMTVCTGFTAGTPSEVYRGSMGAPLPGNTVKMVDQDTGEPVPIGMIGEFCVKGPTLMSGYLGKAPEDCFDDEGYYHTGDGGFIDEAGRFFWSGRLTDMIKTGGANVAPLEVDEVIVKFPGVKRTQTVGVPDKLLGEMVVSCIVPVNGVVLDEDAIKAFVKREVASFKVPRRVLFFSDADYALTGNEKIKTSDLRALAAARLAELANK